MEKTKKNKGIFAGISKLNKSEVKYYLFFIIMACGEAFNKGSDNKIFLSFAAIGIMFLLYKLVDSKYEYKELICVILLGGLGVFLYYQTNKAGGFLSILALIGLKEVDIKKLMKLCFYIQLAAFLLLVGLSSSGIIENTMITDIRGADTIIRYCMGFSHPNQFHLTFIILLLQCMYLYYEKLGVFQLFLLGGINLLVFTRSYSRTSMIIGFFAIFLMFWFKGESFPRLKNAVCMGIIPLGFLISIIPVLVYDKIPNLRMIDSMLQWRITFSRHYLESYSLRLFGNNLNSDPIILDSGYVELLINYGLIFTALYIAGYMIFIYRSIKRRMYGELVLIVCLSIYGITEAFIPNLFMNVSMIFIGELIFDKYKPRERVLN